ncbi:MAG TPA: DUF3618 domain-containing protein [Acetobacteraceae bacterium]|nr:DUF3618 domain-containing protein [Acetobacteraceae bacterium]
MAVHTTTRDPDVVERDLQAARTRLDSRLSELGRRLSPGQIVDEGLDLLRTREGIDFTRNLGVAVRERPIPVALVGIGLAWLMSGARDPVAHRETHVRVTRLRAPQDDLMSRAWEAGRSVVRQTGESDIDYRSRVTEARGKVLGVARTAQETAEAYADRVQEALFAARDRVSDAVSSAADKISSMGASVGDAMQSASDRVTGAAHDLRDQASSLGGQIADQGRRLGDAASHGMRQAQYTARSTGSGLMATLSDNPVLLGAVGLAVGAVLGALLPPTEIEREYLGEAAHDARDALQGVVQEVVDRGSEVVQAAVDAGRQTVQEAVQHASELGGAAKDAARDVAGQAQRQASEMGGAARDAARDVAANAGAQPPRPRA